MLVDADRVEPELLGIPDLIGIGLIEITAALRVEVGVRIRDPCRGLAIEEVVGQVRPRHEVEYGESHYALTTAASVWVGTSLSSTSATTASGRSYEGKWPQSGTITSRVDGMRLLQTDECSTGRS